MSLYDYKEIIDTTNSNTQALNPVEIIVENLDPTPSQGVPIVNYDTLTTPQTTLNYNTRFGAFALNGNNLVPPEGISSNNTAYGFNALYSNISGIGNSAFGNNALFSNTIGSYNCAFGSNALNSNLTGNFNIAVGADSLKNNKTGSDNISVGSQALRFNVSGSSNIALGFKSQYNNLAGSNNISIGANTLESTTNGFGNIAVGARVMQNYSLSTSCNTAVGRNALQYGTNAHTNTVFGTDCASFIGNGNFNLVFGNTTMYDASNATHNVVIGDSSMKLCASANQCIVLGINSLPYGGKDNICIGNNIQISGIKSNTNNIVIGSNSLQYYKSSNIVSIGHDNLKIYNPGSSPSGLISVGNQSMTDLLDNQVTNLYSFGYQAFKKILYADNGVVSIGFKSSLNQLYYGAVSFGYMANSLSIGNQNIICLGSNSNPIDQYTSNNSITLGDSNVTKLRCAVSAITTYSDRRDKADIEPVSCGLDFINDITPVKFKWDKREWYGINGKLGIPTGKLKSQSINVGFVAQDLLQNIIKHDCSYLNAVDTTNPEKLEVSSLNLIFPLINSIKELSAKINALKLRIDSLSQIKTN